MKWIWMIVTVMLAVTGVIGGYNTVESLIKGGTPGMTLVVGAVIAIVCLVLAPRAYKKARSIE